MSKTPTNPSIITRDVDKIAAKTGNVYESITIVGQRARQISSKMKEELSGKLSEFASSVDNLEEIFENREQIEISRHYEKMAKPTAIATQELLEDKLFIRNPESEK
jgi:DNA-directed RNA polymerase subunit K/omega